MKQAHTSTPQLTHGGILAVAASAIALGAQLGILALVMPAAAPQAHAAIRPASVGALAMPETDGDAELSVAAGATPLPPPSTSAVQGTTSALDSAPELSRILALTAADARHPAELDVAMEAALEPIVDTELAMLALHTEVESGDIPEPLQLPLLAALGEPESDPDIEPIAADEVATRLTDAPGPAAHTEVLAPTPENAQPPIATPSLDDGSTSLVSEPAAEVAESQTPSAAEPPRQDEQTVRELSDPLAASASAIAWMEQAEARDWTVQLVATRSRERIVELASKHALPAARTLVVQSERSGRPWYALVHGVYPDFDSAAAAGRELGARLGEGEAWIRRINDVRAAAVSLEATGAGTVVAVPERAASHAAGAGVRG